MPRPCAVESHARTYKESRSTLQDATALRRGVSRSQLQRKPHNSLRCHGLAPWSLTLAATKKAAQLSKMPRLAPWSFTHDAFGNYRLSSAINVSLHGTRPWHPQNPSDFFCSRERESPRRKAV